MKIYRKWLVLLAAAMTLSGCGSPGESARSTPSSSSGTAAESGWDEQAIKVRCADYLAAFRAGTFDSFVRDMAGPLKAEYPPERLEQEWGALMASARAYSGREETRFTLSDGMANVQTTSVHSRYNLVSSFTFSSNETVEALSFKLAPLTVTPESGEGWEEIPIQLGYDPEKQLNGMLTLPKQAEHPPVVILVHGSGAQGMDSLIGAANNRPFADLAQGLAENGIASIRYDKRSYAYPTDVTDLQTEYLYDVRDAVRFALEEPRVDGGELYLIGHSQGGMLSPKFGLENPEIKGIVSLGGTLRRIEDLILEQNETMMAQDTVLSDEEKAAHIKKIKGELDRVHALAPDSPDDRSELLLGYPVSYWISLNAIDQQAIAKELTLPMLILQGDNDFQVLYEVDFLHWQEVLAGRENVTFRHYPGLSHVFMPGSRERFDSSSYDPPAKMDPQVIGDISAWIHSQTKA